MLLGFSFLLGFLKWASTFSPLSIWSVPAVHMRIKDFLVLSVFPSSFPSRAFSSSGHQLIHMYIYCHEQCCLFEFSSLAVILKCSRCFINFIPYPMTDPSHPFMLVLMMLVFKRISLRIPNTLSPSTTNTFPFSLSSPCSPSQTLSSIYSDQLLHHDVGKRSKFFPS